MIITTPPQMDTPQRKPGGDSQASKTLKVLTDLIICSMNSLILASRRLALSNRRSFQTTAKRSGDNFRVLGLQQIRWRALEGKTSLAMGGYAWLGQSWDVQE